MAFFLCKAFLHSYTFKYPFSPIYIMEDVSERCKQADNNSSWQSFLKTTLSSDLPHQQSNSSYALYLSPANTFCKTQLVNSSGHVGSEAMCTQTTCYIRECSNV